MFLNLVFTVVVGLSSWGDELEQPFQDSVEGSSCTASSQCFSHEYCHAKKGCVDAASEPCISISDCVAGESCRLNRDPHRCQ